MSVMPIAHFRTLYVAEGRVNLENSELSIGQFGRLHFSRGELAAIRNQEKRIKNMAFGLVDKTTLPVVEFGRKATEPKVGIAGNGRMVFNKLINDDWNAKKVNRLVIQFDPDTNQVLFVGVAENTKLKSVPDEKMFPVSKAKADDSMSIAASGFLRNIAKYDYSSAGNQSYKAEFSEKYKGYIITLPTETPKPREITPRKKKDGGNGVAAPKVPAVVEAPADEDLVIE